MGRRNAVVSKVSWGQAANMNVLAVQVAVYAPVEKASVCWSGMARRASRQNVSVALDTVVAYVISPVLSTVVNLALEKTRANVSRRKAR